MDIVYDPKARSKDKGKEHNPHVYDIMTKTQKEMLTMLKSYGLSNKEAIYYINHPSKLKAEQLIKIAKSRGALINTKEKR